MFLDHVHIICEPSVDTLKDSWRIRLDTELYGKSGQHKDLLIYARIVLEFHTFSRVYVLMFVN
jgi:hypothetical protein